MLLQELCLHKLNWDDPLPMDIVAKWTHIRDDLKRLAKLSIPRWLNTQKHSTVELHGFSDASQLAMSAVIYLVTDSPSTGARSTLVCAKTRVAPLKKLTIPRLELTAALLLSKLMKRTQATLSNKITNIYMWTDSRVTLTWITSHPSKWKDYVRNRVTDIQELTPTAHWKFVPGTSNPADCASRGVSTQQLKSHELWWTGPPWITQSQLSWPKQPDNTDDSSMEEMRPSISLSMAAVSSDYQWQLIYHYSSLHKLLKVTALCISFISRLKGISSEQLTNIDALERARKYWIMATQLVHFQHELKTLNSGNSLPNNHPLLRLTAFIDHDGILRVGGRLTHSSYSHEERHPAILRRESRFTQLIIDQAHKRTLHGGTQLTLANTRRQYWIIGGRAPIKSHILRCTVCARQRGIRANQLMSQLPHSRVNPSRAFTHTGVDYAGPLSIKSWKGRGSKVYKGWLCVFVCFSTSATHLEVVTDYSTDGFIAAYQRFISRRGIPQVIYSDRGTNFVGADAELNNLFKQFSTQNQALISLLEKTQTRWSFNPPAAPHMGGKWESLVKSVKFHLIRTIGDTLLTLEELTTLLYQIEAQLNSRPLEPLSDDPDDVSVLTPGHFLIGSALNSLPEPQLDDVHMGRHSRWQLIQHRQQQFWKQWSTHYLQRLQSISKWHHPRFDLTVGTLVLITDERLPPTRWPLARVLQLHPGKDGLTRVVTLKTATTTLTRPISKLAILPTNSWTNSSATIADAGENVEDLNGD